MRCLEDNVLVRRRATEAGDGRAPSSTAAARWERALLGDNIASLAQEAGWAGIVLNACVRDTVALDELGLGVKALGLEPAAEQPGRVARGEIHVSVTFGGVTFTPGAPLYADEDGVIVLP